MPEIIGTSIGGYQLLEQIGSGGMAVVYKAMDTHLDSPVAIKFLRTERQERDPDCVAILR